MKYCINCASVMDDTANFCSNCGKPAYTATEATIADNRLTAGFEPEDRDIGYRIILISRENCTLKKAKDVLMDLLGYTSATVDDLLSEMPVEIADELNEEQAVTLAQALTEYGMKVTIVDVENRYVNLTNKAVCSVFRKDGTLTSSAQLVLETLTSANRVHRYRRYNKTSLSDIAFSLLYTLVQPQHVRRTVVHDPESVRRIYVQRPPQQAPARNNMQRSAAPAGRMPQGAPHGKGPQGSVRGRR